MPAAAVNRLSHGPEFFPTLYENELDDQLVAWLTLIVTPAELTGDPILALVRRLARPDVLPDLRGGGVTLERLAQGLREHPQNTFDFTVQTNFHQLASQKKGQVRLLLVIDQLEELFATTRHTTGNAYSPNLDHGRISREARPDACRSARAK